MNWQYIFGSMKINIFSIPPFIVSLASLFLGIFIYVKNKKAKQNIAFFLESIAIFLWLFFYSLVFSCNDPKIAMIFARFGYAGVIFIPVTFYHLVVSFFNISNKKNYVAVSYVLGVFFLFFVFFTNYFILRLDKLFWGWYPKAGFIHPLYLLFFALLYYGSLLSLYRYMKMDGVSFQDKNRTRYLLSGFFIASFACIDFMPNYGLSIYPFGYLFIFTLFCITAYAIVRHQLMDIEVIIKKTFIFGGLFTTVYAVFAFFAFLGQVFFEKFITTNRWVSMMPSVVAVTIMLRPLENFLINVTDKRLFQKKYDYRKLVKIFTSEVLTVLDLEKLIKLTKDKLTEIMKVEYCDVVIGAAAADSKLKIPIILHNQTLGTLLLGNKKSDEDYTQEDLDILHPLAKALGIAISNAKLFEELAKTRVEMAQKDKMATIGTLAAGMAHEIRNPMTTIRNFADYLPERYDDKEFMNKFDRLIPKEIDRIENIARSLLEFSSSEGERDDEDFGAKDVIKTVLSLLEPQYRFSGIGVSNDCKDGCVIRANKGRAQDAIFNIMKYIFAEAPKGSNISINATETIKSVYISIRNKDLITAEYIIKDVFEPVSGLYREKRGFGFDLFIAKQLIERNDGTLNIFSNNRTGSEFRIYFKSASV